MRIRTGKLTAAAVMASALLAAACSGGDDRAAGGGATPPAGGGSGGNLVVWVGPDAAGNAAKKLAEAFGTENGVKVSVQIIAPNPQGPFLTAAQAGKPPDVVMGAHDWIGNLVQNGAIDPVPMTAETRAGFEELAIKAVTFNGQIYGVPYTMNNIVLFRNTELAPAAPKTFEEMVAMGKQLKAAGKVSEIVAYPIGPNGDPYHINPLYTSGGGYVFGELPNGDYNPKDLGVGKPGSVQAYQKIRAVGEKGDGVLKRSITGDNIVSLFTGKKTAFMVSGPWQFADLNKSGISYDVSPVPGFAGGKPARPFITVDAAYVASKGKNKTLAQEFVTNYWSRQDVAQALFEANRSVPALTAALESLKSSDPLVVKVAAAGRESGQIMPSIPAMAAVWDPLGKAEAAVIGGANPTSTIAAAGRAISAQIK